MGANVDPAIDITNDVIQSLLSRDLTIVAVTLPLVFSDVVTVDYATQDESAVAGLDYTAVLGTLSFAPGEITKTFEAPILGDQQYEQDELFTLSLSNPSNAELDLSGSVIEASFSILNDDSELSAPQVTFSQGVTDGQYIVQLYANDLANVSH